ncbi:MAG TPA: glycine zipper 2TM domain-containing protein [Stenotrophobium sp.]|nr:glycine zipper 2TM domain-containing protein [Stenotrophobium sp.]
MNQRTNITLLTGLLAATLATSAFAGPRDWDDGVAYARVVSRTPVYTQVRIAEPAQQCSDQQVVYSEPPRNNVAGTLLGGIIGGVVGHQFGGGRGRDVATAVGAVLGANIGSQSGRYNAGSQQVGYRTVCHTVNSYRYEQRLEGYDVTYRYGGRLYSTRLPYDPGNRMQVQVSVQPASY